MSEKGRLDGERVQLTDGKTEAKNILICGAGAIGSFMGYLLSDPALEDGAAIENVALLGRMRHMERIRSEGLEVEALEGTKRLYFKHLFSRLEELEASDFCPQMLLISVKSYSLKGLCEEIARSGLLEERLKASRFLLLMNGMGNGELFRTLLPQASGRIFEGITSNGVKLAREGRIELKGRGPTLIEQGLLGEWEQFMRARFEARGFQIDFVPDFKRQQWNKLFINSVINPIAALARQQNRVILSPVLQSTVERVVREGVAVAGAEGLEFDPEAVFDLVFSVAERTAENSCSMLQDLLNEKSTEIDSINGYIVRLAKEHSLAVPVNEALYSLIKAAVRGP